MSYQISLERFKIGTAQAFGRFNIIDSLIDDAIDTKIELC